MTINGAESADRLTLGSLQGRTSIEANLRAAGDEGIVGKARIGLGIGNDENVAWLKNGMSAKGLISGRFLGINANFGLEPLAIAVN